jgi:DNA-binding CsgD family transcriptional regulator
MAKLMGISVNTVKKHVSNIYQKLGAVNRADAIHVASIGGLVDVIND